MQVQDSLARIEQDLQENGHFWCIFKCKIKAKFLDILRARSCKTVLAGQDCKILECKILVRI